MQFDFKTRGTCSQRILFEIENGILKNVQFIGGCNGNLKGIGSLVEGMQVDEVISKLEGTTCGMKATSCPDQLASALKKAKESL
ncbi:MAG: TIGR03905 family TSCPD domain-containing protein [Oscillospiraceae bacterium]|nr:TIGR03905 family TSCPD domain-containing protein [Oscillospiraceae bacterium]